jgi:hypothetical protein
MLQQVPTSRSLELEDNYTLMAWINLNMINDGRIIDKASAGKIDGYAFDVRHASEGRGVVRYVHDTLHDAHKAHNAHDATRHTTRHICRLRLIAR